MNAVREGFPSGWRKWLGLLAASMGMFLGALDLTVNVALPTMTASLGADMASMQWIIIIYIGTMTGVQLVVGRLADARGLKRVYLIGIVTYTVAVAAIGLSPNLGYILPFRGLQAFGYAMMLTTTPALVTRLFPREQRGRGLGLMGSVGTFGMISATLGGGYLTGTFGWEAIFLARVPLGVLAFGLAIWLLAEHKSDQPAPVDKLGALCLFTGIASLVLFMNLGGRYGWFSPVVLLVGGLSVAAAVLFILIERKEPFPIIRTDVISAEVARAMLAAFLMSLATFINLFLLPYFMSDVVGATAGTIGFLLMLPPAVSAASSPLAGWLSDLYSPRWIATIALAWLTAVVSSFTLLDGTATVIDIGWRLAAFGLGMGAFQASNANSIMGRMPPDALGSGAAMLSLANGLGMVTSVGMMTLVFEAFRAGAGAAPPLISFVGAFSQTYLVATGLLVIGTIVSLPIQRMRRQG